MNATTVGILKRVQQEVKREDLQQLIDLANQPQQLVARLKEVLVKEDFKEDFKKGLSVVSVSECALVMKNLAALTYYYPSLSFAVVKVTKYLASSNAETPSDDCDG